MSRQPIITGTTRLLGVIGDPVGHSLSPLMHNAALAALGANYVYVPFAIAADHLEAALTGFEAIGVAGFNITIPHKQRIMGLLQVVTPTAQAIGAVNTVWRTEQGWQGTNTDVIGFLAPLKAQSRDWSAAQAVVLGNGGAARAVVAGCDQLGCQRIWVAGRDAEKLAQFQASWQGMPVAEKLSVLPWGELPEVLPTTDLLVNTTPVGMHPNSTETPISGDWIGRMPASAIAYDLIYTPRPTRFLQLAADHGLIALDGLEMLVQQGAAALEIWLQTAVPVEIMRQALEDHLR